jgi:hypothetical protein
MTAQKKTGSKQQTPWLRFVLDLERTIGRPIEEFVRSDTYFDLVAEGNRARAQLTTLYERLSEDWLHLFNLPANSDVRRLREQLSRLEREVNRLAKEMADARDDEGLELPRKRVKEPRRGTGSRPE